MAITLGGVLIEALRGMKPMLETVVGLIGSAVTWFSQLPAPVQTAAVGFVGFGIALGPVVYAVILNSGACSTSWKKWPSHRVCPCPRYTCLNKRAALTHSLPVTIQPTPLSE